MVLASSAESRWNSIFHNTAGIVFLATPHRGSHLANTASRVFGHIPGLSRLLPFLEANSSCLAEVAERFNNLWGTRPLFSFRETMKTYGLMVICRSISLLCFLTDFDCQVVPQENAVTHCQGETVYDIDRDHIDISKPESVDDQLFRQIISAIFVLLLRHKSSYVRSSNVTWPQTTSEVTSSFDTTGPNRCVSPDSIINVFLIIPTGPILHHQEPAKRAIEPAQSVTSSLQEGAFGAKPGDSVWTNLGMPPGLGVPTWFCTLRPGGHH